LVPGVHLLAKRPRADTLVRRRDLVPAGIGFWLAREPLLATAFGWEIPADSAPDKLLQGRRKLGLRCPLKQRLFPGKTVPRQCGGKGKVLFPPGH